MKERTHYIMYAIIAGVLLLMQLYSNHLNDRVTLLEDVALNLDKRVLTCEQVLLSQNDINKAQLDWNTYQNMYNEWVREQLTKKRGNKI